MSLEHSGQEIVSFLYTIRSPSIGFKVVHGDDTYDILMSVRYNEKYFQELIDKIYRWMLFSYRNHYD